MKPPVRADLVIRVRRGEGSPRAIRFQAGKWVAPFAVGKQGAWKVWAADAEGVGLFAKFDGRALSLRGTGTGPQPRVNGAELPRLWSEVRPPAIVDVGALCLLFDAEEHTDEPQPPPTCVPLADRADDENGELLTRVMPNARPALEPPRPAAGLADMPTRILEIAVPPPDGRARSLPLARSKRLAGRLALPRSFRFGASSGHALSWPRRILTLLVPITVAMVGWRLVHRAPGEEAAAASSVAPSASSPAAIISKGEEPVASQPGGEAPQPAQPPPATAMAMTPVTRRPDSTRSPERQAADALAQGDYPAASLLYRDLSDTHPDNPVFSEAARIVAGKISAHPAHPRP